MKRDPGFCVWFTGLPGSGKTTTANLLRDTVVRCGRTVTLLDGDLVRTHLSRGLGFSREDRDTNVRRIAFVASEIIRHRGAVICAAVSPYEETRMECRDMVGREAFILTYINTPLEVCEQRDPKGMYARARRGEIKGFTGVDDPYEVPLRPEIILSTVGRRVEENVWTIMDFLAENGFLYGENGRGVKDFAQWAAGVPSAERKSDEPA